MTNFKEKQSVAVYWGKDENGQDEWFIGTVTHAFPDTLIIKMNFGGSETLYKEDFDSVTVLKKEISDDRPFSKEEISGLRLPTSLPKGKLTKNLKIGDKT